MSEPTRIFLLDWIAAGSFEKSELAVVPGGTVLLLGLLLLLQAETPTVIARTNPTTKDLRIGGPPWGVAPTIDPVGARCTACTA
jgi:hypothetical protein